MSREDKLFGAYMYTCVCMCVFLCFFCFLRGVSREDKLRVLANTYTCACVCVCVLVCVCVCMCVCVCLFFCLRGVSREDKLRVLAQEAVADLCSGEAFALCLCVGRGEGALKSQGTRFAEQIY